MKSIVLISVEELIERHLPGLPDVQVLEANLDRKSGALRLSVETPHLPATMVRVTIGRDIVGRRYVMSADPVQDDGRPVDGEG